MGKKTVWLPGSRELDHAEQRSRWKAANKRRRAAKMKNRRRKQVEKVAQQLPQTFAVMDKGLVKQAIREVLDERERKFAKKMRRQSGVTFYESFEWQSLRYQVLKEQKGQCQLCGRTRKDGVQIHVDHIKPRSRYPELELSKSNLQVLCKDCNIGKLHLDDTDWRDGVTIQ